MFPWPFIQKHETVPTADDVAIAACLASEEVASGASAGAENAFCGSTLSLHHKANMLLAFLCEGGSSGLINSVSISLHGSSYLKKGKGMKAIFFCLASKCI